MSPHWTKRQRNHLLGQNIHLPGHFLSSTGGEAERTFFLFFNDLS